MKTTIDHNRSEILIKIELDELQSANSRQQLAEQYVDLSARIDQLVESTGVNIEFGSLPFNIDVFVAGTRLEEEATFRLLAEDEQNAEKLAQFITNVNRWCQQHEAELWQEDDSQQGEFAAYVLCMKDEKYIPLYREQLALSDMDHEVYQFEHIESIVNQHGLTKAVLGLLAERIGAACGQHGTEQLDEFRQPMFELFRQQPAMQEWFLSSASESFYRASEGYQLWFEAIRVIASHIEDEQQREQWLGQQQQRAEQQFGNSIDWTEY
ncbi:hypothetical protein ACFOMG_09420 [Bacterioplanoides pacificum]|uniref:Uncharacterized protein n=2 Tax=Bacterioplanoides pacificum TaxID=1171596 RepID=A0ABV7VS49_9GAMM